LLIFFAATSIILSKKNDAFSSKELTLERIRTELLQKQYSTIHQGAAYQGYIPSPVEMFKKNVFSSARMSRVCGNELLKKNANKPQGNVFLQQVHLFLDPSISPREEPGLFPPNENPGPRSSLISAQPISERQNRPM
jgi:hypothetical protein